MSKNLKKKYELADKKTKVVEYVLSMKEKSSEGANRFIKHKFKLKSSKNGSWASHAANQTRVTLKHKDSVNGLDDVIIKVGNKEFIISFCEAAELFFLLNAVNEIKSNWFEKLTLQEKIKNEKNSV